MSEAEAILDVKHWGNSLGVRLPAAVARAARLKADEKVRLTVEGGRIIITPMRRKSLTLGQRLELFDPERHGGESMRVASREGVEAP
jgi:antitoxin MazE